MTAIAEYGPSAEPATLDWADEPAGGEPPTILLPTVHEVKPRTWLAVIVWAGITLPTLEALMESKLALHIMRDQLGVLIPPGKGSVIIADELTTNYLDGTGGYHLIDHVLFRRGAFQKLQWRLDHTDKDQPFPVRRSRALAMIEKALDAHKRMAIIVHGGSLDDMFRNFGALSAQLLSSWQDKRPLPPKDTGVFAIWNASIRNAYPPANHNNATWSIYEVTR